MVLRKARAYGGEMGRSPWRVLVVVILLAFTTGGCTLRHWGGRRGIEIGTAASAAHLGDVRYGEVLGREFNLLTPENELKWEIIHPRPEAYDFAPADELVDYAASHDMRVRGTPLLWHSQNPSWLTDGTFTRAELLAVLVDHIATLLARYPNVVQWDVVNEAFDDAGRRRASVWQRIIGDDYVDLAFETARRADANAELYYNDYNIEFPGPKADAVFQMVSSMKQRGVPIDGVGLQMHALSNFPTPAQVRAEMRRYESIGVDVAITEMDVRLDLPVDNSQLEAQRVAYAGTLQACLDAPNCNTFVVWGFTDRYSWIPLFFPGYGSADLFDGKYRKKPAYQGLVDVLDGA
jgi:endo-1,4-beta-xylanase